MREIKFRAWDKELNKWWYLDELDAEFLGEILQAVRTAWRIVKDWVEAQMALVETRMVTTQEVFLPYAVMRDGRTLAQTVQSNPSFLLGSDN